MCDGTRISPVFYLKQNKTPVFIPPSVMQTINPPTPQKTPKLFQPIHISYINVRNAITTFLKRAPSPGTETARIIKPSHRKQLSCWTGSCQGSQIIPPKLWALHGKKKQVLITQFWFSFQDALNRCWRAHHMMVNNKISDDVYLLSEHCDSDPCTLHLRLLEDIVNTQQQQES